MPGNGAVNRDSFTPLRKHQLGSPVVTLRARMIYLGGQARQESKGIVLKQLDLDAGRYRL